MGINLYRKGHFFNEKQKEIKGKIMVELMQALFLNIENYPEEFNDIQSLMDLVTSILVMFNRDVLIHTFTTLQIPHMRKDIMKALFEEIKNQVNFKIKNVMM